MSKSASEARSDAEIPSVPAERVISRIGQTIGEDRAVIIDGLRYRVSGEESRVVVFPHTQEELAETLRLASAESWSVIPAGAGTWLEAGNRPLAADLIVSTARLDRVLEYEPADLTATVEAGCPLAKFNQQAREHGQWIPLDPFGAPEGTIGATIATASYGPLRCGYGIPRDWLIGIRVAHIDGKMTRAGGKVVKNVAGYDLCKLYTGSFGTLAIITEMTFKLRSLATAGKTVIFRNKDEARLATLATLIQASPLQPSAMELLSPDRSDWSNDGSHNSNSWMLAVQFLHEPEAVESQIASIREMGSSNLLTAPLAAEILADDESQRFWREYRESEADTSAEWLLRLTTLPADLPAMISLANRQLPGARWRVHAANGVLRLSAPSGWPAGWTPDETLRRLLDFRQEIRSHGGQMVVLRAPGEILRQLDVWGDPGSTLPLMRAIKQKFDPHSRLNPGRFVAGI